MLYALIIAAFLIGAMGAALFLVLRRPKKKRFIEFKKKLVVAVISTYFLGIGIGVWATVKDTSQLYALLTYIGAPTTGAILSYCWVVRTENAIKLKKQYPEETEGYNVDLNNTNI